MCILVIRLYYINIGQFALSGFGRNILYRYIIDTMNEAIKHRESTSPNFPLISPTNR